MSAAATSRVRSWLLGPLLALAAVLALTLSSGASGGTSTGGALPMLGANLPWSSCGPAGSPYVIAVYGQPGVRRDTQLALHAMRAAGVEAIGLFVIPSHDPLFWQIPTAQGRLTEPWRTNVINLVSDIRAAGFERLTLKFQPQRSSDMKEWTKDWTGVYDPATFEETWSFIQDVRALAKQFGPASTRFDILAEGAPSDWERANKPAWARDLTRLYRSYVEAFGNEDVTISPMANGMANWGSTDDVRERVQNLIDLLRASGEPLPTWFAVSLGYDPRVLEDLRAVDETLVRNGLSQPLVISESVYDEPAVAAAIATYMHGTTRPLAELDEYPLDGPEFHAGERVVPPPRCVSPPYRVDAYAKALRGARPSRTLRGSVEANGRLSLLTPTGQEVKALIAGTYTLVIRDASVKHSFHLYDHPDHGTVDRASGKRFRGTKIWKLDLGPDPAVTYAAEGRSGTHRHFSVLVPGVPN